MKFLSVFLGFLMLYTGALKADSSKNADIYSFSLPGLSGKGIDLSEFKGKVLLFVNTASHCGFTGQYAGLQKLHEQFSDKGLVVIGVPSDSFKQEFHDEKEVASFCKMNYGVKFAMTKILPVTGDKAHPLYKYLSEKAPASDRGKEVKWNFEKFLVDHQGVPRFHYSSQTKPDSKQFVSSVKELLENSKKS